tara:strand:- start:2173 stop:2688 length:516 start_codon:yes stop_codon:yes gene_type:complete
MKSLLVFIIFIAMVYKFMDMYNDRDRRFKIAEIERQALEIAKQKAEKEKKIAAEQALLSSLQNMEEVVKAESELTRLKDVQARSDLKNVSNIDRKNIDPNSLVEQALILQRRGRPEQREKHIQDATFSQQERNLNTTRSNVTDFSDSTRRSSYFADASNPTADSTDPIHNF